VQCAVCHKFKASEGNGLGPNLAGVVGRKAGTVAGFAYSPAMKDSGKTWDEASLNSYIEKPMAFVPGNRMAFAGEANPAKRAAIIEALKAAK
jgi:cytochrome c